MAAAGSGEAPRVPTDPPEGCDDDAVALALMREAVRDTDGLSAAKRQSKNARRARRGRGDAAADGRVDSEDDDDVDDAEPQPLGNDCSLQAYFFVLYHQLHHCE